MSQREHTFEVKLFIYIGLLLSFVGIVGLFLVNVMLGLVYDAFIAETKYLSELERVREMKGLVLAFSTLDPNNKGSIDEAQWCRFLKYYFATEKRKLFSSLFTFNMKHQFTNNSGGGRVNADFAVSNHSSVYQPIGNDQAALFYFQIASDFTGVLDVISFLDLREHLSFRFSVRLDIVDTQADIIGGGSSTLFSSCKPSNTPETTPPHTPNATNVARQSSFLDPLSPISDVSTISSPSSSSPSVSESSSSVAAATILSSSPQAQSYSEYSISPSCSLMSPLTINSSQSSVTPKGHSSSRSLTSFLSSSPKHQSHSLSQPKQLSNSGGSRSRYDASNDSVTDESSQHRRVSYHLGDVPTSTLLMEQLVKFFDMKYMLDAIAILDTLLVLLNLDDKVLFSIRLFYLDVSFNKLFTLIYSVYYLVLLFNQVHHSENIEVSRSTTATATATVDYAKGTQSSSQEADTPRSRHSIIPSHLSKRKTLTDFWHVTLTPHDKVAFLAIASEIVLVFISYSLYYIHWLLHYEKLTLLLQYISYGLLHPRHFVHTSMLPFLQHCASVSKVCLGPWLNTLILVARMFRCWRLVARSEVLQEYVDSFIEVFPLYFETLGSVLLLCFSFSMLGCDIERVVALFGLTLGSEFASPHDSLKVMIQLLFDVDFGDVLTAAEQKRSNSTVAAINFVIHVTFILTFRFVVVMVHLNLVNAMVIQFYSLLLEQAAYQETEAAEISSVEASLSRKCTHDATLRRWGSAIVCGINPNIEVSKSSKVSDLVFRTDLDSVDISSSSVMAATSVETDKSYKSKSRRFYGVSAKALSRCSKYATNGVDLLAALESKVFGDNAFRAFEHRFSMMIRQYNIGVLKRFNFGERIISKGDKGDQCYVLEEGEASVCRPDGKELVRKQAGEIFGEVSFLNGSERTSDVFAVQDGTIARIFTTSDWLQMDSRIKAAFAERIAVLGLKIRSESSSASFRNTPKTSVPQNTSAFDSVASPKTPSVSLPNPKSPRSTNHRSPRFGASTSPSLSPRSGSNQLSSPRKLRSFTFNHLDKHTQINDKEKRINNSKLVEDSREDEMSSSPTSTISSNDEDDRNDDGGGSDGGVSGDSRGGDAGGSIDYGDVVDDEVTIGSVGTVDSSSLGDTDDQDSGSVNYSWMSPI